MNAPVLVVQHPWLPTQQGLRRGQRGEAGARSMLLLLLLLLLLQEKNGWV